MKSHDDIRRAAGAATAAWLIWCFSALAASGGTLVKTFDFGAGGDNPTARGHARSFLVPQGVAVAVRLNYRTSGEGSVPLTIEIEDAAGRNLATREVAAEKSIRQIVVNFTAAENAVHGCDRGWQIRVQAAGGEAPKARVFGDITVSYIDAPGAPLAIEGQTFSLPKGGRASRAVGTIETFRHPGVINIKSSWTHSPLTQALPLKFELVRPDGSVAKTLVGYGTNSNAQPKLDFDYRVLLADTRQTGFWRLQITNATEQEISEINPSAIFTRRCFE